MDATSIPAPRVLLVEDDLDVAAGIGEFLSLNGIEVDFAVNANEALHVVADGRFDVLVLDLHLPGEDGISLCHRLKQERGIDAPVIFLTAHGALDTKLRAFDAGALDYVVKPFEPAELLARLRAMLVRNERRGATGITVGAYQLDVSGHLLWHGEHHLPLSVLATRLLQCLMRAWPAHVSREALCAALWDGDVPESDPLRAHVHQLRRSLSARFGSPLIITLRGVGYRFDDAASDD